MPGWAEPSIEIPHFTKFQIESGAGDTARGTFTIKLTR